MIQRFVIRQPTERAYVRNALFALELLDGVTLSRVTDGVLLIADGLRGKPTVNATGLFVWRSEDLSALRKITVDPGTLPYEKREITVAELRLPPDKKPLTTVELSPRTNYVVPVGITGLRGTLIEERVDPPVPVLDAKVRLAWLDEDGVSWREAPTLSVTNSRGDFLSVLRLASAQVPNVDAGGSLTVRLRVKRDENERSSTDVKLVHGRVAEPTTEDTRTFAWDELQF